MKIEAVVKNIVERFAGMYTKEQAQIIAWWLLEALTKKSRTQLITDQNYEISPDQYETLKTWLTEHIEQHKPLAYIIGSIPFCDLSIKIEPPLLIPRPETEEWVLHFINEVRNAGIATFSLLDLCTGSGCIALAVANAFPKATIFASDINPHALACAQENAKRNDITNVTFMPSDLFAAFNDKHFDFIVANPPYISYQEKDSLEPSVREWESPQALFADDHGYALIKKIITQAPHYFTLSESIKHSMLPMICIEIGYQQGSVVSTHMKQHGYTDVQIRTDYAGHDRVVCGRYTRDTATIT